MRNLICVLVVAACTVQTHAKPTEILDTQKWPAHLAGCWQDQPTTHAVFFLEQPDHENPDLPEAEQHIRVPPARPAIEGTIFASKAVGLVFLFGGLAGWFALAAAVFVLERRPRT